MSYLITSSLLLLYCDYNHHARLFFLLSQINNTNASTLTHKLKLYPYTHTLYSQPTSAHTHALIHISEGSSHDIVSYKTTVQTTAGSLDMNTHTLAHTLTQCLTHMHTLLDTVNRRAGTAGREPDPSMELWIMG